MAKRIVRKSKPGQVKRTPVRARTKPVQVDYSTLRPSEQVLSKPQVVSELAKSPHGDLSEYVPIGLKAAKEDPDFFGHLLAWDARKGEIRDAKVALPVIALVARPQDTDYVENALAHMASLDPRLFVRALDFAEKLHAPSRMTRRLVKRYVHDLEADPREWERVAVQHRASLTELYTRFHLKAAPFAKEALLDKRAPAGRLKIVKELYDMSPLEAAGAIAKYRIPFLIARGALREKIKNTDLILALINAMSPTEVVTNTKNLQKLGIMDLPACRAAFEEALKRAAESKAPKATLKTSQAAKALAEAGDEKMAEKLNTLQEKQLDKLKGIEGNWLVLADKSGSMTHTIDHARQITAILARMVKGQVHLVFFDTDPRYFNATGKTLEQITTLTKGITAGGGTNIGCGIRYAAEKGLQVDGIAIVSDGEDGNAYGVPTQYRAYVQKFGAEPSLYFYHVPGGHDRLTADMAAAKLDMQVFDLTGKVDYYSLPNVVQTMRVGRYSLLDEILDTDLKKLDQVLKRTAGQGVVTHGSPVTSSV